MTKRKNKSRAGRRSENLVGWWELQFGGYNLPPNPVRIELPDRPKSGGWGQMSPLPPPGSTGPENYALGWDSMIICQG